MKKLTTISVSLILIALVSTGTFAQNYKKLSDFPEYVKKTNPYKRFAWFFQPKAFPYDSFPCVYANNVASEEFLKIKESNSRNLFEWNPKGPSGIHESWSKWGVVSGRIRALAVHPTNINIVYSTVLS